MSATPESTLNVDSTCTLVESDLTASNNFEPQQIQQSWGGGGVEREGLGMAVGHASGKNYTSGHGSLSSSRSRGVPVAPLKPEGEKPLSKAFMSTPKRKVTRKYC